MANTGFYRRLGKRLFDLSLTIPCLLILVPGLALVALFIRLTLGSPVFYQMQRPGLYGRPFMLHKFRTMRNVWNAEGQPLPDEERLIPFGRWLRHLSIDELPELFNVLKGEMSLVGPRPLRMEYLELYTNEQRRRHDTLPGITGWAQINGRNSIMFEEKVILDLWYVDHQTWWIDVNILLLTLPQVFFRRHVEYSADASVSEVVKRLQTNEAKRRTN